MKTDRDYKPMKLLEGFYILVSALDYNFSLLQSNLDRYPHVQRTSDTFKVPKIVVHRESKNVLYGSDLDKSHLKLQELKTVHSRLD